MEQYFLAKRRLFELLPLDAVAITNADDRRGADFAAAARRPVTYAIEAPADVRPGPIAFSLDGLEFEARTPRGTLRLRYTSTRPGLASLVVGLLRGLGKMFAEDLQIVHERSVGAGCEEFLIHRSRPA